MPFTNCMWLRRRAVFGEDFPVHLCTYHVVTAWYKLICQRVKTESEPLKATIKRIFKGVHAVMKHPGTDTLQGSKDAVKAAFEAWKQTEKHQTTVIEYFEKEWEKNISAQPASMSFTECLMHVPIWRP
jgi:ribosomal protein L11 methylase PrmA